MIAIITEKPSVARDIARVVGATGKQKGYLEGNGYLVTWALGHLVQLAPPEYYGRKLAIDDLPIIPDPFQLVIRQRRNDKGKQVTDSAAARQLNVIDKVLGQCHSIIAATDAGREGELIFRWIYSHTACKLPVKRLWISSLTDEAIVRGLENLRDGKEYDNLHRAAECRAKADWLVGINASAALAAATHSGNHSLGRVQTPTLALICSRYLENRGFLPSNYWQLHISVQKDGSLRKFPCVDDFKDKMTADETFKSLQVHTHARIGKVEKKTIHEQPPLLYDLTTLQKDCNIHYDMSAEKTLNVAQSLYEKKLISYPRTGSRYISQDIQTQIPSLLRMVMRMEQFSHFEGGIDFSHMTRRSIDASKVTDHHALLITGDYPGELSESESRVYHLIAGRMLEAFAPKCEKESLVVDADYAGMLFRSRFVAVINPGWRGVYSRPEERSADITDEASTGIEYAEGESLPVMGHSLTQGKTKPKPLFTEATLLAAMETAGKHVVDEQVREAIKDCGLGTPATRAAIIETLFAREYIERSGKSLIPTEKGLYVYKAVKDMRITDPELTGNWEQALASIEKGNMKPDTFMNAITVYTRQVTQEVLSLNVPKEDADLPRCPKCRTGNVTIRHKIAKCDNPKCGLVVYRNFLNKPLTELHIRQLLTTGKTRLIRGFQGKQDKTFDARLAFDKNFNLVFLFPDNSGKSKKKTPKPIARREPIVKTSENQRYKQKTGSGDLPGKK